MALAWGAWSRAEPGGDHRAPVATLRQVGPIAQHLGHQGVEQAGRRALADRSRGLGGKAEAGQGGHDQVEGVGGLPAEPAGEGQLLDRAPELVMRTRPAVGDDEGPAPVRFADNVQEMEVEILDPRGELREAVEVGHRRAPVVGAGPVGAELFQIAAVAAIGPAVGNLRARRPGIGPHPVQHGLDLGLAPAHLKWLYVGHLASPGPGGCFRLAAGAVKPPRPSPAAARPGSGPRRGWRTTGGCRPAAACRPGPGSPRRGSRPRTSGRSVADRPASALP